MKPIAVVLALCGGVFAAEAPNAGVEALKKDVGAYGWSVMETAKTVLVFNSAPKMPAAKLGEDFAARLRQAILEGQTAPPVLEKACTFEPGIRFQFQSGADSVDVAVDFACNKLEITSMDPKAPQAVSAHRYFDDWRAALVRLAQEAIPEQSVAKDLKPWEWEPNAAAAKAAGAHATKVLRAADKVEVYRIKPEKGDPTAAEQQVAGGYPVISKGPDRGPAFAARLATLLLSGKTQAGFDKHCSFSPGVVFVVHSGADFVSVIVCFTCDEIRTETLPPKAADPVRGEFDLDASRAAWLEMAKQALPADETIQGLDPKPK